MIQIFFAVLFFYVLNYDHSHLTYYLEYNYERFNLFQCIACLFATMLCHGIAPTGFLLSKLDPYQKNKRGNKCDSNNYRQIAISSLLFKVFDIIILDSQSKSLGTEVSQFGFKKNQM